VIVHRLLSLAPGGRGPG